LSKKGDEPTGRRKILILSNHLSNLKTYTKMTKRTILSTWVSALFLSGAVVFYSCSSEDMEDERPLTKAELLRAKAKEFSQKYGVEMSLNEENIDSLANVLTVEQMEKDFQAFAALKNQEIVGARTNKDRRVLSRKIFRVNHNTSIEEDREQTYESSETVTLQPFSTSFKVKDSFNKEETVTVSFTGSATVFWKYGLKVSNYAKVSLTLQQFGDAGFRMSGESNLNASFNPGGSPFGFSGSTIMTASSNLYQYTFFVNVEYKNNVLSVGVSARGHR